MIGADRRGMQAAYEAVSRYPQGVSVKEAESIARKVLATMRADGYAHLDPESEFIRGFVQEFQMCSAFLVVQK